jgi:cobalt-precorrin 5A hydrolase / precorrin-3B C17-methyltransferase
MNAPAIVILGEGSMAIASQIQATLPQSLIYGIANRTQSADIAYLKFGETVQKLFSDGCPIIGVCASGILIRTLAPLLADKRTEPPVIAIAEDGSAVVPLLGGLNGANELAKQIAIALQVLPAITTTGEIRFHTRLLTPPLEYGMANSDLQAKSFLADLLAGATVKLVGEAAWLSQSNIPFTEAGTHIIEVLSDRSSAPQETQNNHLIYYPISLPSGKLAIVGIGPGSRQWMSPQVKELLKSATDLVGYKTYLDLVQDFSYGKTIHASDNRVELDRARQALDLAVPGKSVVMVSSGDPGIYAMASAVFEVLDGEVNPKWQEIQIQVAPGISAMQAAAAMVGAPLGHDFCVISLSDILKPWQAIAQRLKAAAEADFAIAIYNPVSQHRTWQLTAARDILLEVRSPNTPVVLARNLGRSGQRIKTITLGQLSSSDADMRTIVLIGSSQTRTIPKVNGEVWVYTPRTSQGIET